MVWLPNQERVQAAPRRSCKFSSYHPENGFEFEESVGGLRVPISPEWALIGSDGSA